MFSSYQNSDILLNETHSTQDNVSNLDELDATYGAQNNLLSYFNFISSSNKYRKMKYYIAAIIIFVILILMLLNITSSHETTAISTPLSATNDMKSKETEFCKDDNYFKKVLKEEYSQVIGGIIQNVEAAEKYEASGVVYDPLRDVYWVVFDSLYGIGKLSADLTRNEENLLVVSNVNGMNDNVQGIESGYEGIALDTDTDTFYLLTESIQFSDNDGNTVYHSIIRSAKYDEALTYIETQICAVNFDAASGNKGFESLNLIKIDDEKYFVGLCEGNYCDSGKKGKESGNGRMVLVNFEAEKLTNVDLNGEYQYLLDAGIYCIYKWIDMYELPNYVDFIDYSAFQFRVKSINNVSYDGYYDLVVASQESSAIWVGEVVWSLGNGPDFTINRKDGKIYTFPKNDNCETIFCNVEGVTFINNNQFVMVSDKAKGKGAQPWICGQKDQSIHIFKVP